MPDPISEKETDKIKPPSLIEIFPPRQPRKPAKFSSLICISKNRSNGITIFKNQRDPIVPNSAPPINESSSIVSRLRRGRREDHTG